MTLVRRAAVKTAGFVVRHASSGCRYWAEGLAREVEFIESDWAALWWAMGSARVLLDRRETPITSVFDVAEKARKLPESLRHWYASYKFPFAVAFIFMLRLVLHAHGLRQSAGLWMVVASLVFAGTVMLMEQRRRVPVPQSEDAWDWARYYRSVLHARSDFRRSGLGRMYYLAIIVNVSGVVLSQGENISVNSPFVIVGSLFYLFALWLLFQERREVRRQIIELDALLEESR